MNLFPAIDIYEGKAVRLYKGDYEKMTVYSDNPFDVASKFASYGAEYVHVVDLEGARNASSPNFKTIADIASASGLKVEIGGGIRSRESIERYLGAGAFRVILGTVAVTDPEFLEDSVKCFGDKIAVGVDIKDDHVAIRGWTETSSVSCDDFCSRLEKLGVKTVICTDISQDGTLNGANRTLYKHLHETFSMDFIASGGISGIEDILALKSLGLYGAIIGKAYYTGAIDIREAIEVVK